MPGKQFSGGKPYLSIVAGNLSQKAEEGDAGAKLRKYELKDGTKGEKWEITYTDWEGKIIGISFEDAKFGKMLKLELEDAILSINTDSRYFQDLAKKLVGADLKKPINFHPYDFEGDEGKKTGVSMEQDGEKLYSAFWDNDAKKSINGFPEPEEGEKDSDDWKAYFIGVKKFLVKQLEELEIPVQTPEEMVATAGTQEAKQEVSEEFKEETIDDSSLPF